MSPHTVGVWSGDTDDEIVFIFQAPHSKIKELTDPFLGNDDPTFPDDPRKKVIFTGEQYSPGGVMRLIFVDKEAIENRVGEILRMSQQYGFEIVQPAQQADQEQQAD